MKKIVLLYGIISGLLLSLFMVLTFNTGIENLDPLLSMIIGYLGMIVAFVFIFIGIRNFRDKMNNGVITFGKAFTIGLYISLIASTFYVATWLIEFNYVMPDFMDKYAAAQVEKMRESGALEAEVKKYSDSMLEFRELYKNPFITAAVTYTEILPMGIVMSLVAAAILKRREPRQSA